MSFTIHQSQTLAADRKKLTNLKFVSDELQRSAAKALGELRQAQQELDPVVFRYLFNRSPEDIGIFLERMERSFSKYPRLAEKNYSKILHRRSFLNDSRLEAAKSLAREHWSFFKKFEQDFEAQFLAKYAASFYLFLPLLSAFQQMPSAAVLRLLSADGSFGAQDYDALTRERRVKKLFSNFKRRSRFAVGDYVRVRNSITSANFFANVLSRSFPSTGCNLSESPTAIFKFHSEIILEHNADLREGDKPLLSLKTLQNNFRRSYQKFPLLGLPPLHFSIYHVRDQAHFQSWARRYYLFFNEARSGLPTFKDFDDDRLLVTKTDIYPTSAVDGSKRLAVLNINSGMSAIVEERFVKKGSKKRRKGFGN